MVNESDDLFTTSMQYSNLLRVLKIHQNDLFDRDDDDIFSPDVSMSIPGAMHAM